MSMRGPKGNEKKRRNANHSAGVGRWLVLWELRRMLIDDAEQVERGVYWLTRSMWARVWYAGLDPAPSSLESQWWVWRRWAEERRIVVGKQAGGADRERESGLAVSIQEINRCVGMGLGGSANFHRGHEYPGDSD